MSRISARLIGSKLGMNAHGVNLILEEMGYITKSKYVTISGSPTWELTAEGERHGELSHNPNSFGFIWDEDVVQIIKQYMRYK